MFKNFRLPKKATTALLTALIITFNDNLGLHLSADQIGGIVVIAIGYIYGQTKVDQTLIDNGHKDK